MPVAVLFFQQNGLSQSEIFLLQSIFAVTAVIFEVPSGYFADLFGRRISLITGASLLCLGWTIYIFSHGFAQIAVAEMLIGLA
jgi:MFS family permease